MWNEIEQGSYPEPGVDVLVYCRESGTVAIASFHVEGDEAYWESDSDLIASLPPGEVTHWAPLPPPPSR